MQEPNALRPDLYEEIVRLRKAGQSAALATIVRRIGSTPRKDNAKMLIRADGSTLGSVGGGCVEAEVWQQAKKVIESNRTRLVHYEMTDEDAREEGLICGGTVEVFVEPITPQPKVVILGAGHVGQAIAQVLARLGYKLCIVDDRETFANRQRFPWAQEIRACPFTQALEGVGVPENSFVLVVTRGHSHDQDALEAVLKTPVRYLGLVGSRRKVRILVENLLKKGHFPQAFENLYAPIGLSIGSETPEEIAVSVAAELIAIQKGVHQRSPKQQYIRRFLQQAVAAKPQDTPRPADATPAQLQSGR